MIVTVEPISSAPDTPPTSQLGIELESTVVDLKIIETVMPNYEADRQPA